nr:hypothetical protein [Sphingomonas ginkgonis]
MFRRFVGREIAAGLVSNLSTCAGATRSLISANNLKLHNLRSLLRLCVFHLKDKGERGDDFRNALASKAVFPVVERLSNIGWHPCRSGDIIAKRGNLWPAERQIELKTALGVFAPTYHGKGV